MTADTFKTIFIESLTGTIAITAILLFMFGCLFILLVWFCSTFPNSAFRIKKAIGDASAVRRSLNPYLTFTHRRTYTALEIIGDSIIIFIGILSLLIVANSLHFVGWKKVSNSFGQLSVFGINKENQINVLPRHIKLKVITQSCNKDIQGILVVQFPKINKVNAVDRVVLLGLPKNTKDLRYAFGDNQATVLHHLQKSNLTQPNKRHDGMLVIAQKLEAEPFLALSFSWNSLVPETMSSCILHLPVLTDRSTITTVAKQHGMSINQLALDRVMTVASTTFNYPRGNIRVSNSNPEPSKQNHESHQWKCASVNKYDFTNIQNTCAVTLTLASTTPFGPLYAELGTAVLLALISLLFTFLRLKRRLNLVWEARWMIINELIGDSVASFEKELKKAYHYQEQHKLLPNIFTMSVSILLLDIIVLNLGLSNQFPQHVLMAVVPIVTIRLIWSFLARTKIVQPKFSPRWWLLPIILFTFGSLLILSDLAAGILIFATGATSLFFMIRRCIIK